MKWDPNTKSIDKKQIHKNSPTVEAYLINISYKSPAFFISERYTVDKRFEFFTDGSYYTFSSSIPENMVADDKEMIRCVTYMNTFKIWEDKDYFHFSGIYQSDTKVV